MVGCPGTWEAEAANLCELEYSLVYRGAPDQPSPIVRLVSKQITTRNGVQIALLLLFVLRQSL